MHLRIHVYSIMRNEERLLPYFLRHYLFADRIFVWEDESTDRTREILEAEPRVTLLPFDYHGINDHVWVTQLWPQYRQHSRGDADWAICVDADEFVYAPDLLGTFEGLRSQGVQLVRCYGYTMIADAFPTTGGQIYDEVRRGIVDRLSHKDIVFDPALEMRWRRGRHGRARARRPDGSLPLKAHHGEHDIKLLHFRYLGADYFADRYEANFKRQETFKRRYYHHTRLPDRGRDDPVVWYEQHKHEAMDVISSQLGGIDETKS